MSISMSCPSCGKTLSAPDNAAGKKAKCPFCGQITTVPEAVLDAEAVGVGAPVASGGMGQPAAPPSPATGSQARQPCPECGEMIVVGAAKCRFCNAIFDPKLKLLQRSQPGRGNEELRQVAAYQRGVIFCLLFQILAYVAIVAVPHYVPALALVPALVLLIAGIGGIVFVFLVATRVYTTGTGIVMGLLMLVPCVGIIILAVVNQAATKMLTENGIKVGFFGASMSQF